MEKVEVFLLGPPRVYINKKRYLFPYGRAEGMFYYLVTKGYENKQILEDIFWGDKYDEEKANRNYRNALYHIRKAFGKDFLITDGRQQLKINPEADLWIDLEEMKGNLEILSGKENFWYLDHFEVKESSQFESFIRQKRVETAEKIYSLAEEELGGEKCRLDLCEEICKNLISMDEFCEKYYQLLMRLYEKEGQENRAEMVYRELKYILEQELDEVPGEEITRLWQKISSAKERKSVPEGEKPRLYKQEIQSEICETLLKWISMFCDRAEYRKLKYFSNIEEDLFVEGIESLVRRGIIQEEEESGRIYYSFPLEEERKRVYESLSLTKRKSLHRLMAKRFEKQFFLGKNEDILPKISYHYFKSQDREKSDFYLKEYLSRYLTIAHQYFPVLHNYDVMYNTETYLNNKKQIAFIYEQMEKYVEAYKESVNPESFEKDRLELYLTMLVQSYVKIPDYERSWEYIRLLEELQGITEEILKQKAFSCMDTYQADELLCLSREGVNRAADTSAEQGFWKRLLGIGYILKGEMEKGRQELLQAAEIFLSKEWAEEWGANAAVAYSWLGEIGRLTKDYDSAMEYYRKSLDINANVHNISGKTLLYLHMGKGLFDTGNDKMAERYIKAAVQSFEHLHVMFKRSSAYSYEAVLLFRKGDFEGGAVYLEKAGQSAVYSRDPFERCLYIRIISLITKSSACPCRCRKRLEENRQAFSEKEEQAKIPSLWERKYLDQFCIF